jgi:hypothetical protein
MHPPKPVRRDITSQIPAPGRRAGGQAGRRAGKTAVEKIAMLMPNNNNRNKQSASQNPKIQIQIQSKTPTLSCDGRALAFLTYMPYYTYRLTYLDGRAA